MHNGFHCTYVEQHASKHIRVIALLLIFQVWLVRTLVLSFEIVGITSALRFATCEDQLFFRKPEYSL